MNFSSPPLPEIFFSSEIVLVCLREFQRVSGDLDENVIGLQALHVFICTGFVAFEFDVIWAGGCVNSLNIRDL